VTTNDGFGEGMAIGKQANDAAIDFDKASAFHATNHFGDRWARNFESFGDACLNDVNVVFAQLEDGLAIFSQRRGAIRAAYSGP